MSSWYRRSKLLLDGCQKLRSQITQSNVYSFSNSLDPKLSVFLRSSSRTLRNSGLEMFVKRVQGFHNYRRYYYVDRNEVQHFRPRGPRRWFRNQRIVIIGVLVGSGIVISVYYGNLETVPYSHRDHVVLLSRTIERQLGEKQFQKLKEEFRGQILSSVHPASVRVRLVSKDIIMALQKGLKREQAWKDSGHEKESNKIVAGGGNEISKLLQGQGDKKVKRSFNKDDEILDDKWVQESRRIGQERACRPSTLHLNGLDWEVVVVNQPLVNAFCLPGGKIVVFMGLLKHFPRDDELATVIGHEVGHVVARHAAEIITKNLWFTIMQLILLQFFSSELVITMSNLLLRLPFSRRMEMEADYIGLLLMASAGYDPRIAPSVYERLGKLMNESSLSDYISTHPSGKKRATLLAKAKVMEEALDVYKDVKAGRFGVEGFLSDSKNVAF